MQTSKIKLGEEYAMKRGDTLIRFHVEEIVTRKDLRKTSSELVGYIVEDTKPGMGRTQINVDPSDLIGPYAEQLELVEREKREKAEYERKEKEQSEQAAVDRITLYRFVGEEPPIGDASQYRQPFRLTGYRGATVDATEEGMKLLVARIREFEEAGFQFLKGPPALRVVK
jgi:hypothetical protein